MAAEQILHGLSKDFLQCSICMNRYQNPLMLPCLHSFCSSCLEKWKATAGKRPLSCPTCRRSVNLPKKGVKWLPTNFLLTSLMERLDLGGKLNKEKSSNCDFCKNRTGTLYCTDCQLHVCLICRDGHSRIPGASEHVMIAADKGSDVNYLKEVTSKKPPRCPHHPQEKLRFYCTSCSKLVCRDCTLLNHQGHKCYEAEQKVSNARDSLQFCLKESQSLVKNSQQGCQKLNNLTKLMKTHTKTLKSQVDNQYDKYVKLLNSQKNALYQEIQKMEDEKSKKFTETLSHSTHWLKATENTQQVTKQILEGNNQWEILGNAIDLKRSFQSLKQEQAAFAEKSKYMEAEAGSVTEMKFFPTGSLTSYNPTSGTQHLLGTTDDSNVLGKLSQHAHSDIPHVDLDAYGYEDRNYEHSLELEFTNSEVGTPNINTRNTQLPANYHERRNVGATRLPAWCHRPQYDYHDDPNDYYNRFDN